MTERSARPAGLGAAAEALLDEGFAAAERLRRSLRPEAAPLVGAPARGLARAGFVAARAWAGLAAAVPARGWRVAWRELDDKLEAFELFQEAPRLLGLDPEGAGIAVAAERARRLGSWQAPWAVEGFAYHRAAAALARGEEPDLRGAGGADLPATSLVVLHTGSGLALAERALGQEARESGLAAALARFVERCRALARPGFAGAMLEAVGLVARTLHPDRVRAIGRTLAEVTELEPQLAELFWHGAGRALCFLPTNAAPCASAPWRAVGMAWREPPDDAGRDNALAGLAWALTLVNLRHPEVLEAVLRHHAATLAAGRREALAFADGVGAAVVVWRDLAPGDRTLPAFLAHRPAPEVAPLWQRLVAEPGRTAVDEQPALAREGRLGEVFRCRFRHGGNR